ncbi:MAG TPA: magnesium transporter [Actinomycetota bacterium]|nr:magnesium transporter [Actinomycetota bacterium]
MDEPRRSLRRGVALPIRWVGGVIRALVGPPARAIRGSARIVADPAAQVVDYWASERSTIRQSFTANVVSTIASLVAGLTLAGMEERITAVEGLFILIPVSIGMRGSIFGALSARLGSSIHSGLFSVSKDREGVLFQNAYAAALLTVVTSVVMGILARAIAALLGIDTVSVWDFIAIALVGGVLSSAVVLAFTVYLSITSFNRSWDLDSVGAVLVTTVGDLVTLPCLFLASFLVDVQSAAEGVGVAGFVLALLALVRGWTNVMPVVRRVVRESFPVLALAIVLDILAGTVVQPRMSEVFLPLPAFLILLPGFLENTGALGSILAARLGSKLHLGAVSPTARPGAPALLDASIMFGLGLTVYAITAISTLALATAMGAAYPGALRFIGIVMLAGILATVIAALIGYYAAVITYRFGWDPDNHTIPLVTSGMDLLGVVCLVVGLNSFGIA